MQQHQSCVSVRTALGRAGPTCCSDTFQQLPPWMMTTLHERLGATKNIDAKTHTVSKAFSVGERQQLSTLERGKTALNNMRAGAFVLACQALLYSECMSEAGIMNRDGLDQCLGEIVSINVSEEGRGDGGARRMRRSRHHGRLMVLFCSC